MSRASVAAALAGVLLAYAVPGLAQDLVEPAARATKTYLDQGVLGATALVALLLLVAVWLDARRERKEMLAQLEEKDAKMLAVALGRTQDEMEQAKREERAVRRAVKNTAAARPL